MKIYCNTCKYYVLDTSDEFRPGGPYNGSMFAASPDAMGLYFQFSDWVTEGELMCPQCQLSFLSDQGELLTEFGLVRQGQVSIDTKKPKIVYEEGPLTGLLKSDSTYSSEISDEIAIDEEESASKDADVGEEMVENLQEALKERKLTCSKCGKVIPYPSSHRKTCDD